MITFFALQEALLNTPIAHSGRPEVVLRSSKGRSDFFLSGHFFRPLSVETAVFDDCLCFFFFLKTQNRRPLSHLRCFLVSYETPRNRFSLVGRSICGVFFVRSFSASLRIFQKNSKNVELSHILGFESLFCFVFRTSVLRKRRTVERKFVPTLQNRCFSYGTHTVSYPNLGFSDLDQKTIKIDRFCN